LGYILAIVLFKLIFSVVDLEFG